MKCHIIQADWPGRKLSESLKSETSNHDFQHDIISNSKVLEKLEYINHLGQFIAKE